jgi:hypothetical protein
MAAFRDEALKKWARPLWYLSNNRTSQWGIIVTTTGTLTMASLWTTEYFGVHVGPYIGILAFLILPAIVAAGLLLIPLGLWLRFRSEKTAGRLPEDYPKIDLRDRPVLETLGFIGTMTVVNLGLFLTATYRGVHYMDSVEFCGRACHSVMQPEYAVYQNSPHARVECVKCHIGPGAPWFVRSKLSGAWQVVSVNLNLYPRPIPTPIENLRPSRDTCEQCHWPLKFAGERLVVRPKFAEDETNTESTTVLLMHTGGLDPVTRKPLGNHGVHLEPGAEIHYAPADRRRQEIPYVLYRKPNGETTEYVAEDKKAADYRNAELRLMDCVDCHNRPTHTFEMPGPALDQAFKAGLVDTNLPFLKKNAMELLKAEYASQEDGVARMRSRLRELYPNRDTAKTADAVTAIFSRNIFPQMKIQWGTYPNNLGHEQAPGCFRCHDGSHTAANGRAISNDCSSCHNLLAVEEKSPEVLKSLGK